MASAIDNSPDFLLGVQTITFVNGKEITRKIVDYLVTQDGVPIYLIGATGIRYNWQNIISIKRIKETN